MSKHLFCKACDCKVGVTRLVHSRDEKTTKYECNNCLGEITVKHRVSAKQKKTNDFLAWLSQQ